VDLIGLSILSGVHLEIADELMAKMKMKKMEQIPVVVGESYRRKISPP